jgi:hypothetical protein
VLPTGRYDQPVLAPVEYPPSPKDLWRTVPLPWETQARKRAAHAVFPALVCFGLLLYFAWKRRWLVVLGLLVCAIAVPLVAGALELGNWENRIAAEQHHAWGGWYWLWVDTLSAANEVPLSLYMWVIVVASVFFLPPRRRLVAIELMILLAFLLFVFGAHGPAETRAWLWEFRIQVPAGFTLGSPLLWTLLWLSWVAGWVWWKRKPA